MTYLYEIEDLPNKIHEIVAEKIDSIFNDENTIELVETLLNIMKEYINDNSHAIMEEDFEEVFKEDMLELLNIHFENEIFLDEELEEDLEEILDFSFDIFFTTIDNSRSLQNTDTNADANTNNITKETNTSLQKKDISEINALEEQINYLREKPQPAQRTDAWYQFRYNLITASSAHKVFESQCCINQLIYEKCQPLKIVGEEKSSMVNVNTPLHWGQKYEPLSVLLYENMYNTKIEDFGCIQHDIYSFLGASPDGINVDKTSGRFGRMLEIKNVVSRVITGVPLTAYWIQMQLQMEVCNLDECDFLETKFAEYENESDFYNDSSEKSRGVIMYFNTCESKPYYVYKPLNIITQDEIMKWEEENLDLFQSSLHKMTWIRNIYWKLEKLSCVLVLRDKKWFQEHITQMGDVWKIIEKERITGCQHRAPNKKNKGIVVKKQSHPIPDFQGCFINLKKTGVDNLRDAEEIAQTKTIIINTETIRERKMSM